MTIFPFLCLLSLLSASTLIPIHCRSLVPIDSHTFFTGYTTSPTVHNPKSSDPTVIPVDSQTFFSGEPTPPHVETFSASAVKHSEPSGLTVIPVDSQTFFSSEPTPPHVETFSASAVKHSEPSGLTVIPVDSQTFFSSEPKPPHVETFSASAVKHSEPSGLTVIPVDSQTFFNSEPKSPHVEAFSASVKHSELSGLTVIPVDSQTFFNSELEPPRPDTTVPLPKLSEVSQTFFTSEPKPPRLDATVSISKSSNISSEPKPSHVKASDSKVIPIDTKIIFSHEPDPDDTVPLPKSPEVSVIPIDSQKFFTSEPKVHRLEDTIPLSKSSNINSEPKLSHVKATDTKIIPIDSKTFFTNEPEAPQPNTSISLPKSPEVNVMPIDSQTFFTSKPKPPPLDATATAPLSESSNINSEPKHKDSASYCSVYLKKEDLKKGTTVCPFFAKPSPIQESTMRSICEQQSQETEFKFCSSSYQDISKKVTNKLGKNKLASSSGREIINISTITGIKKVAAYGEAVICHKAPYVGFYCHQLRKSSVFALTLSALNGDHIDYGNMLAVCHDDTTSWNRKRTAFVVLKAMPGDAICHLLPSYDLVFAALT